MAPIRPWARGPRRFRENRRSRRETLPVRAAGAFAENVPSKPLTAWGEAKNAFQGRSDTDCPSGSPVPLKAAAAREPPVSCRVSSAECRPIAAIFTSATASGSWRSWSSCCRWWSSGRSRPRATTATTSKAGCPSNTRKPRPTGFSAGILRGRSSSSSAGKAARWPTRGWKCWPGSCSRPRKRPPDRAAHLLQDRRRPAPRAVERMTSEPLNLDREEAIRRLTGAIIGPPRKMGPADDLDQRQTCLVLTFVRRRPGQPPRHASTSSRRWPPTSAASRRIDIHMGGPPVDNVSIDRAGQTSVTILFGLSLVVGFFVSWWSLEEQGARRRWCSASGVYSMFASLAGRLVLGLSRRCDPAHHAIAGLRRDHAAAAIHLANYYRDQLAETGIQEGGGWLRRASRSPAAFFGHGHDGRRPGHARRQRACADPHVRHLLGGLASWSSFLILVTVHAGGARALSARPPARQARRG